MPVVDHAIGDFVDAHGRHPLLVLTAIELLGHPVSMQRTVDGHRCHLPHPSESSAQQ
jgi:hypothetical protein